MRKGWLRVAGICLGLMLFCSCSSNSSAQETSSVSEQSVKTLRFYVSDGLRKEVTEQSILFAEQVKRETDGSVVIEVISDSPDYETVKNGDAQIAFLRNLQLAQADELLNMLSLPFLYDDYTHMSVALNSEQLNTLFAQRLAPQNIVPLAAFYNGSSYLVTDQYEVRRPADFKELVIAMRTDNEGKLSLFEALGALVLPYTLSSVVPMLDTKVEILPEDLRLPSEVVRVNTVEVTLGQVLQLAPDPYKLYFINTYHTLSPLWMVANKEAMSQLTAFEQAVIAEGISGMILELERTRAMQERELLAQIQQAGFTIVEIERATIAAAIYGGKGTGTDRYTPPAYFDRRLYKLIQSFT